MTLYDARFEHDACGIGFVAHVDGRPRREVVTKALAGLAGVKHRGAVAADGRSGDGAGILTQIPRDLVFAHAIDLGHGTVSPQDLGLAFLFLDADDEQARQTAQDAVEEACAAEDITVLGWREVPVDPDAVGDIARSAMPHLAQAVLQRPEATDDVTAERLAYRAERRARAACEQADVRYYAASFSFLTVTYKAMADADQLDRFYDDLTDERFASSLAVFHSRFSTNTLPTWERAQPFDNLCH